MRWLNPDILIIVFIVVTFVGKQVLSAVEVLKKQALERRLREQEAAFGADPHRLDDPRQSSDSNQSGLPQGTTSRRTIMELRNRQAAEQPAWQNTDAAGRAQTDLSTAAGAGAGGSGPILPPNPSPIDILEAIAQRRMQQMRAPMSQAELIEQRRRAIAQLRSGSATSPGSSNATHLGPGSAQGSTSASGAAGSLGRGQPVHPPRPHQLQQHQRQPGSSGGSPRPSRRPPVQKPAGTVPVISGGSTLTSHTSPDAPLTSHESRQNSAAQQSTPAGKESRQADGDTRVPALQAVQLHDISRMDLRKAFILTEVFAAPVGFRPLIDAYDW